MKITRALLLVSFLFAADASAKCAPYALSVFPSTEQVLPTNPALIVFAYGRAESLIDDATKWSLVGPDGKDVGLRLVRDLSGYQEHLVVFVPIRQLAPNTTYTLSTTGEIKDWPEAPIEKFSWRTGAAADTSAPQWKQEPVVGKPHHALLGCGPSTDVEVRVDTSDTSALTYEVTLASDKTKATYFVEARAGSISIGHGMCSGSFQMQLNTKYRASIVPVDAAGNRGATKEISFKSASGATD